MDGGLRTLGVLLTACALAATGAAECGADATSSIYVRSYEFDEANVAVYDVGGPWTDTAPALVNVGASDRTRQSTA